MSHLVDLRGVKIGFALTGSHCTLELALAAMRQLKALGAEILPILSPSVLESNTRFGTAFAWREAVLEASGSERIITTIVEAEPIGPKKLLDLMLIAPCSGNTLAKLASGVVDTAPLMAAKAHLRNQRPLLLAPSTNDGLANAAKNIGVLLNSKQIYFVPFGQDDPFAKPNSLVADLGRLPQAASEALAGRQVQPLLYGYTPGE